MSSFCVLGFVLEFVEIISRTNPNCCFHGMFPGEGDGHHSNRQINNAYLQTEVSSMDLLHLLALAWIEPEELEKPRGKKQRKEECDVR